MREVSCLTIEMLQEGVARQSKSSEADRGEPIRVAPLEFAELELGPELAGAILRQSRATLDPVAEAVACLTELRFLEHPHEKHWKPKFQDEPKYQQVQRRLSRLLIRHPLLLDPDFEFPVHTGPAERGYAPLAWGLADLCFASLPSQRHGMAPAELRNFVQQPSVQRALNLQSSGRQGQGRLTGRHVLDVAAADNGPSRDSAARIPDVVRGVFLESVVGLERAHFRAMEKSVFQPLQTEGTGPSWDLSYGMARLFLTQVESPTLTGLSDVDFIALHKSELPNGFQPFLRHLARPGGISRALDGWGRLSPALVKERVSRAVQLIAASNSFSTQMGSGKKGSVAGAATKLATYTYGTMSFHRGYPKGWTVPAALAFIQAIQDFGAEDYFSWPEPSSAKDLPNQWKKARALNRTELVAARLAAEAAAAAHPLRRSEKSKSKSSGPHRGPQSGQGKRASGK